jgi:two-component system, chemotaxis family, chemotaxis protein CheY
VSARVLVVDDDDSIRQIVRIFLTDEGYEVLAAAHGKAALDVLDDFAPDLILLDLRMPVMDGWEFARCYRERPRPHAPIVAFVAALNAEQDSAEVGADAVLSKPFDLDELARAVSDGLALKSKGDYVKT